MELKDIVLKKDDIVIYKNGNFHLVDGYAGNKVSQIFDNVYKIERVVEWETIPKELNPTPVIVVKPIKYETIYEAPKEILTKEEKEWLENFLRPFIKARIRVIKSAYFDYVGECGYEELTIMIEDCEVNLPPFNKDAMYKGMELDKEYTLKELGLFEGE